MENQEAQIKVLLIHPDDAERIMLNMAAVQVSTFAAHKLKDGRYLIVIGETMDEHGEPAILATILNKAHYQRLRERGLLVYEIICRKTTKEISQLIDQTCREKLGESTSTPDNTPTTQ